MKQQNNFHEPLEFQNQFNPLPSNNLSQPLTHSTIQERPKSPLTPKLLENKGDSDSSIDSNLGSPRIESDSPYKRISNEMKASFMNPFFSEAKESQGSKLSRIFRENFENDINRNFFDNSSSHSRPWEDLHPGFPSFVSPFQKFDSMQSRIDRMIEETFSEKPAQEMKNIEEAPVEREEEPEQNQQNEQNEQSNDEERMEEETEENSLQCYSHGLPNLGNTCYMNSVLQCLLNSDINRFILEGEHLIGNPDERPLTNSFAQVLCNAFTRRIERNVLVRSLFRFKNTLERLAPIFKGYNQNDAHEFFRLLIEKIHDELNDAPKKQESYSEFNPSRRATSLRLIAEEWLRYSRERDNSIITDIFGGILLNEIICTNCNKASYTFQDALDLPLNLPGSNGASYYDYRKITSLYTSLDDFVESENVEGYKCENCKSKDTCMKKTTIWKAPEILVIQLKRFVYDQNGELNALKDRVSFPLDNLSVEYFMHQESNENRNSYKLYGIVNHTGSLDSGHYISYIYNEGLKRWLEYNDRDINVVDDQELRLYAQGSAEPYLLLYKRV